MTTTPTRPVRAVAEYEPDGTDEYSGDPYWVVGLYESDAARDADTRHLFGGRLFYTGDRRSDGPAIALNGVPLGSLSAVDAGRVARAITRWQAWMLATGRAKQADLWPDGMS